MVFKLTELKFHKIRTKSLLTNFSFKTNENRRIQSNKVTFLTLSQPGIGQETFGKSARQFNNCF